MTDTRNLIDFSENLEWNLVAREARQAQPVSPRGYLPIPDRAFAIENSYTVMIGIRSSSAERHWFLGCWAEQRLLFVPSSTTEFVAAVKTKSYRCQLETLTLCTFSKLQSPWLLLLRFPWWLEDVFYEVWRYDGRDENIFEAIAQTNP